MKKIYKYPTGAEVPEGAKFLSTQVEKTIDTQKTLGIERRIEKNALVWHYFLVEVEE